jgi:aminomethyltransferase
METELRLSEIGEDVATVTVIKVLVEAGEGIDVDQPVIEIETDKAIIEIPSTLHGVVREVRVAEGDEIQPGEVILTLADENPRRTPLYHRHLEAGARMVPFAGWLLPVQYTGIIEEHLHVREKAGLFDICHMGEFYIEGPTVSGDINRLVTCRIDNLAVGRCRYGFLTRENGTIVDDLITFRTGDNRFMLVVNAATRSKDVQWIRSRLSSATKFQDASDSIAKLDLQGPASADVLAELVGRDRVAGIKRFHFADVLIQGVKVLLSRTGYTGELGFELFFSADEAEKIWDLLLGFDQVKPIGLGARDTLRLEVGYPLYGHDINDSRTPIEANMARFVYFEKDFIGREALRKQLDAGTDQRLMAFVCEGRRSAREHFEVLVEGRRSGEVTSAAFSPCLKKGIGLCYINRQFAKDAQPISLRGDRAEIPATLVPQASRLH